MKYALRKVSISTIRQKKIVHDVELPYLQKSFIRIIFLPQKVKAESRQAIKACLLSIVYETQLGRV